MFLDDVVTRAGRDIVAIGPNGRPGVIGKQGSLERIAMVWTKRIRPRAHGVAHVERTFRITRRAFENRQNVKPSFRKLVVTDDSIAAGLSLTFPAESLKNRVRSHRSIEHLSGLPELCTLLGVNRHPGVHNLYDVIRSDRKCVVGWIP